MGVLFRSILYISVCVPLSSTLVLRTEYIYISVCVTMATQKLPDVPLANGITTESKLILAEGSQVLRASVTSIAEFIGNTSYDPTILQNQINTLGSQITDIQQQINDLPELPPPEPKPDIQCRFYYNLAADGFSLLLPGNYTLVQLVYSYICIDAPASHLNWSVGNGAMTILTNTLNNNGNWSFQTGILDLNIPVNISSPSRLYIVPGRNRNGTNYDRVNCYGCIDLYFREVV